MKPIAAAIIILSFFILLSYSAIAQAPQHPDSIFVKEHPVKIKVRKIIIEGNKRTRDFIILRQLPFKEGDSLFLPDIPVIFEESKNNLTNLSLFTTINITLTEWTGFEADVIITLKERWYTFPQAVFDIYDRNFNVWWVEHNHNLNRVQYGMRFMQQNVRGRAEDLSLTALFGYAQRFDIGYKFPYIDKKLTKGLKFSAYLSRQRNIAYASSFNKELFHRDRDRFIRTAFGGQIDFTYRPKIHFRQVVTLGYNRVLITDTLHKLNPFYLQSGRSEQYLFLTYSAIFDNRDWASYPLKGYYAEFTANKPGLGLLSDVNITNFYLLLQQYRPLSKKFFFGTQFSFKYSLPAKQPYYNQRGLGYSAAYISGYEYYVTDGQAYCLGKFQLRFKLLSYQLPLLYFLKKEKANVPFSIFPKIYYDIGYVRDNSGRTDNPLANTILFGYGAGIDLATSYDFIFKVEYTINRKSEKGIYLHFSSLF